MSGSHQWWFTEYSDSPYLFWLNYDRVGRVNIALEQNIFCFLIMFFYRDRKEHIFQIDDHTSYYWSYINFEESYLRFGIHLGWACSSPQSSFSIHLVSTGVRPVVKLDMMRTTTLASFKLLRAPLVFSKPSGMQYCFWIIFLYREV